MVLHGIAWYCMVLYGIALSLSLKNHRCFKLTASLTLTLSFLILARTFRRDKYGLSLDCVVISNPAAGDDSVLS